MIDWDFAAEICRQLLEGKRKAILQVHARYHAQCVRFVKKRLYQSGYDGEDIMNEFWMELMNGKAICAYSQKKKENQLLSSFLLTRLNWRIKDYYREIQREAKVNEPLFSHRDAEATDHEAILSRTNTSAMDALRQPSPEQELIQRQLLDMVFRETFLQFSERYPEDELIIRQHIFKGKTHEEIADSLGKTVDAVKKRYSRPDGGSLAKFRTLLTEKLKEANVTQADLLSEFFSDN